MNFKIVLKWLPIPLTIGIAVTLIISSFDGVVLAAIVSNVTKFNSNSTVVDAVRYGCLSLLGVSIVYVSMALKELLKNRAIRIMNIHLKRSFIYSEIESEKTSLNSADAVSKISNDFKLIETDYFSLIFEFGATLLTGFVSACYILMQSIPVGLFFILFSALPMVVPVLFGGVMQRSATVWQKDSARYTSKVTDLIGGLASIRSYFAQKQMYDDSDYYLQKVEHSYQRMNDYQAFALGVTAILSMVSFLLPLTVGLVMVSMNLIAPNVIIAIFLASDRVVGPLRSAVGYLNQMKMTKDIRAGIKNVEIIFDKSTAIKENVDVKLNKVSFSYDDGEQILKDVSLDVPATKKVLIIGPSGTGKTTILNLIQGWLKPTSGTVELVDEDGSLIPNENAIAYIQQKPYIFNDSLKFNLTLGTDFSDGECLKVLKQVGLVDELGGDLLEKEYGEGGQALSGGQRQRVEIARALLFSKKVFLLDEATSSLDDNLAAKIRELIWKMPYTVIEVAHHYNRDELKRFGIKCYQLSDKSLKVFE